MKKLWTINGYKATDEKKQTTETCECISNADLTAGQVLAKFEKKNPDVVVTQILQRGQYEEME